MAIEKELLDHLFANYNYQKPEDLIGENGLLKQLTKAVLERALQAEMTVHLGHEKHGTIATKGGNARNGKTGKPSRAISAICLLRFLVTETAVSIHSSFLRDKPASQALMTR